MATFIPAPSRFSVIPNFNSFPGVSGYNMAITGSTTFTVSPGYARSLCSDFAISFPSFQPNTPSVLSVDISTVGPGGCYPNSIASLGLTHNTIFGVYVLGNSAGTTGGSLVDTANATEVVVATGNNFLISPEYDSYRRIGLVYVDHSTGYLIPFQQSGNGTSKTYVLQDPVVALTAGAATAATVVDLTANDGAIIPNTNVNVLLDAKIVPNAAGGYVALEPGSLTAASATPVEIYGSVASQPNSSFVQMTATPNASTGNANIQYFVDNAGSAATLNVVGWVDNLGNQLF